MSRSSSGSASAGGGIGFFGMLAIVFIVLKLLGKITWSWGWVLAPLWMPTIIAIVVLIILYAFASR